LNSKWYSVYRQIPGGELIRQTNEDKFANEGCAWECEQGFIRVKTASGLELCVLKDGAMAARYASAELG
jgi:hypothetical protein